MEANTEAEGMPEAEATAANVAAAISREVEGGGDPGTAGKADP